MSLRRWITAGALACALAAPGQATAQPIEALSGSDDGYHLGSVAIPADGRNAYAAGGQLDELTVFTRDPATGELDLLGYEFQIGGDDLVVSPDGAHVYVSNGDGISIFERAPLDGDLSAPSSHALPPGTGPCALAASADGDFVLAACAGADAVLTFTRDAGTGALEAAGSVAASGDPADIAITSDGTSVYVAAPGADAIHAWSRDVATGALTPLDDVVDGVEGVAGLDEVGGLALTPDGTALHAIGRDGTRGDVATLTRDPVSGALAFEQETPLPANQLATRIAASDFAVWVLSHQPDPVWMQGTRTLLAWSRDVSTNELSLADRVALGGAEPFGSGGLALDPDDDQVLATGNFFGIERARIAPDTDLIQLTQTLHEGEAGVSGIAGPTALVATRDGRHLIVIAKGTAPGVTSFARDAADGTLTFRATSTTGLVDPHAAVASPGGDFVYVADATSGIARFGLDPNTSALIPLTATTEGLGGSGARLLALSRDGRHLYAAGAGSAGVAHYDRDSVTGALVYVATNALTGGGSSPSLLGLSADERFLQAVSAGQQIVVPRNATTGALGSASTAPNDAIRDFVFPPRGAWLHAVDQCPFGCSASLDSIPFDPATGAFGSIGSRVESPVLGSLLDSLVPDLLAAPDGRWIYLIGAQHFAVFTRDAATGRLSLADAESAESSAAALSPRGDSFYLASATGALRVYAPEPGSFSMGAIGSLATALGLRFRSMRGAHSGSA